MKRIDKFYSTGKAAAMLSLSSVTIKRWAESGQIKSFRTPGGRYMIPESEIKRLLEPLEGKPKRCKKK